METDCESTMAFVDGYLRSLRTPSGLRPQSRVNRQGAHLTGLRVEKGAVMGELPIAEELRQHGQSTGSKRLVDERLLPVESFDRRTAWQGVLAGFGVDDLGIKFADRAQPTCLASVTCVQRLTEDVLSAVGIIAEVE